MISQYSVVIPCFRRYNELRTTLTSLAKQTVLPEATLLIDNNEFEDEILNHCPLLLDLSCDRK